MVKTVYSNGYHTIIDINYGVNDYVIFQSHDKKTHKLRIYYTKDGAAYFNYHGVKYHLNEFFKCEMEAENNEN